MDDGILSNYEEKMNEMIAGWEVEAPGVLTLPGTKFKITHIPGSSKFAFRITWNGEEIPLGDQIYLSEAKYWVAHHMKELVAAGVKP